VDIFKNTPGRGVGIIGRCQSVKNYSKGEREKRRKCERIRKERKEMIEDRRCKRGKMKDDTVPCSIH
jgi:hypothetical protein